MQQADWFESWFGSPWYHILYQDHDNKEAQAFVEKLLHYLQPPAGCRMADIACGEGRYSVQLAEHGYEVMGIDLSHPSIETAKAFENDHLQFAVHDMRMPFYINYFDYAFNFFTSFGYFEHQRDHQLAAKSFAACLKPGGILVVDYLNCEHAAHALVPEETVLREPYTFHITKRLEHRHFLKDIRFADADGKERHYTESVAAFGLEDFRTMFQKAGMTLMDTFGNYKLEPYHPAETPRLIMIFKKQ